MVEQKQNKQNILNYTINELEEYFLANGIKKYLAQQVFQWIYQKRINSFVMMSNVSKQNIAFLNEHFYIKNLDLKIKQVDKIDGTTKFLFKLDDNNLIESVLMKFDYGYSVCVTTQVGCNMGCKFCASGLLKKKRNLEIGEIVNQVLTIQKYLDEKQQNEKVSNIVVMGIGEPFDNFSNLIGFLRIINHPYGLQIGARKITVSTCGLVNKFEEWTKLMPQIGLAISLHAPNDNIRSSIMPINKAYKIHDLIEATKKYISTTNRRVTFEYIMLKDVNDQPQHAKELANLLKDVLCYVNLIPYNPVNENSYQRSQRVKEFANILNKHHIRVTTRQEKGTNIDAACGQLRAKNEAISNN